MLSRFVGILFSGAEANIYHDENTQLIFPSMSMPFEMSEKQNQSVIYSHNNITYIRTIYVIPYLESEMSA